MTGATRSLRPAADLGERRTSEPVSTFSVLVVCTGNICRSPMAERLLRARLGGTADVTVTVRSAGTRAVVGWPMDEAAAAVLRELGGDAEDHVARQLTADLVRDTDLVLTASAEHRARILRDTPALMRRVFTLREFARLGAGLDELPGDADRAVFVGRVREVADQRGVVDPVDPAEDEIGDPFGAPIDVMRRCGADVLDAVDRIAQILGATAGS